MSWVPPSPVAPPTFEPLDSHNAVPGDAEQTEALAVRYADTAQEISDQVTKLTRLANESVNFWKGQAAGAYHDKASDLAGRIGKAKNRYESAHSAVHGWALEVGSIQERAYQAVTDAQAAEKAMRENDPSGAPSLGPNPTDAQVTAAKTRSNNYSDATQNLKTARGNYADAVSDYGHRSGYWAKQLRDALDGDPEHDSWMDRNFGWIKTLAKWIGVIVLAIVVVALIIGTCGLFADVLILGMSVVTFLNSMAAVLTAVALVAHTALYASGHGSLTDVVLDIAALATFGVSLGIGKLAEAAAEGGKGIAGAVGATRAGRAAMESGGLPKLFYNLARQPGVARNLLSLVPGASDAFASADEAASSARAAVEAIEGSPGALGRLAAFGDPDLAGSVSVLSKLDDMVPGTLRLSALSALGKGFDSVVFGANGAVTAVTGSAVVKTFTEPEDEGLSPEDQSAITQISDTWSQPFSHLAPTP